MNEAYGKDGVKQLKKDYADLKKNPPKIEKEENYFVVKIYSNTTKGYIGVAEYTKQAVARADLKHFMKDHKETLAKIDKLSKDVVKESENMDDDFNTLSKRIADLGEVGDTIFYNDLNIPDQMLRNSDAFAFGGRNGLGIGFESIEEAELDEGLRLPPEIAKKLSAMVAGGAKGKIIPFQSRFGNDKSTFGYTDAKGNKHDVIVTNGKLSRKETAAIIQGIRDKFEVKESLNELTGIIGGLEAIELIVRGFVYGTRKIANGDWIRMIQRANKDATIKRIAKELIKIDGAMDVMLDPNEKAKKKFMKDNLSPQDYKKANMLLRKISTETIKQSSVNEAYKIGDKVIVGDPDSKYYKKRATVYNVFKATKTKQAGMTVKVGKDVFSLSVDEILGEGFGADTQKKKETASDKAWKELQKKHSGNKKLLDKASEYYAKNYTPKAAFAKAMTNEDTINVVELFKENKSFHRHEKQVLINTLKGLLGDKVTMDFGNPEKMTATYKGKVVDVTKAGKQYVATYGNKIVTSSSIDGAVLKHPKITIFEEVIEEKMSSAVRNAFDEIDYQYTDLGTSEAYFKVNKEEMDEFLKKLGKRQKKKGDTYFKGKYDVVYDEDKGAATFKIKTASKNQNIYGE